MGRQRYRTEHGLRTEIRQGQRIGTHTVIGIEEEIPIGVAHAPIARPPAAEFSLAIVDYDMPDGRKAAYVLLSDSHAFNRVGGKDLMPRPDRRYHGEACHFPT